MFNAMTSGAKPNDIERKFISAIVMSMRCAFLHTFRAIVGANDIPSANGIEKSFASLALLRSTARLFISVILACSFWIIESPLSSSQSCLFDIRRIGNSFSVKLFKFFRVFLALFRMREEPISSLFVASLTVGAIPFSVVFSSRRTCFAHS